MADIIKYADIKDWDVKTIDAKVDELRKEMFNIRMQSRTTGEAPSHRPSNIRKSVARLLTAKREQERKQ